MDFFFFFTCLPILSGFVEALRCLLIQPESKHYSVVGRWSIQILLAKYKYLQETKETISHSTSPAFKLKAQKHQQENILKLSELKCLLSDGFIIYYVIAFNATDVYFILL